jgi:hypothetical protein
MGFSVPSVLFSVAEFLDSPPALERHHKMRFSIIVAFSSVNVCVTRHLNDCEDW